MSRPNTYGFCKKPHPKRKTYNSDFNVVAIRLANKLDKFGFNMLPSDLLRLLRGTSDARPDLLRMRLVLSVHGKRPFRLGEKGTIT